MKWQHGFAAQTIMVVVSHVIMYLVFELILLLPYFGLNFIGVSDRHVVWILNCLRLPMLLFTVVNFCEKMSLVRMSVFLQAARERETLRQ